MREDGIAQHGVWKSSLHGHLNNRHDLAGLGPEHRETKNGAVITRNQGFMNPCISLIVRVLRTEAMGIFAT